MSGEFPFKKGESEVHQCLVLKFFSEQIWEGSNNKTRQN